MSELTVLFPDEGETPAAFLRRIEKESGSLLLVFSNASDLGAGWTSSDRAAFLDAAAKLSSRIQIATKQKELVEEARALGIRVIDAMKDLKRILGARPDAEEVIRVFSPHLWQQKLRSNLQSLGLLSLPKLRVWILIAVSAILFFFVLFRLLPSAELRVRPRQDAITQTVNIFLVLSGATVDIPDRVRTLELMPIIIDVSHSLTFDEISKEFIGESATVAMTVINESDEQYSLRTGTRLANQAGMIFRLAEPVNIDPGDELTVRAVADDMDLYGEIIGDRGNVPEDLKWEFPGLAPEERTKIYGVNKVAAKGGITQYRTVLHEGDLDVARLKLEQKLLDMATQLVDEHRVLYNSEHDGNRMEILYYEELTKAEYKDFMLPRQFLGEPVTSVPVEGRLVYTAYAYDSQRVLELLSEELKTHVEQGKRLLENSLTLDRLVTHVIDYNDDLTWIKLTVDLTGTEEFILDPLSPTGARLGQKIRGMVSGTDAETALRIIKNLPEVEHVEISIWPPWNRTLPHIPSQLSIGILPSSRNQ